VQVVAYDILTEALALGPRESVALVGGGGKTGCLRLLAQELSEWSPRVLAATTTAVFLKDLADLGPVLVESDLPALRTRLVAALAAGGLVCAVRSVGRDGKAVGLPVEWVDDVWAAGYVDHLVLEADGSRGMSLKAFEAHEPQVPLGATLIVQVAGLDVLGAPLQEPYVHRAELLARALGVEEGALVTADLYADALRKQLRLLHERWPSARVVTFLNKAEEPNTRLRGLEVAEGMLNAAQGEVGRGPVPEAVVVGSLRERDFTRIWSRGADERSGR
jgi:probable selenium-dependent hydroxylase accessory protein YqeC